MKRPILFVLFTLVCTAMLAQTKVNLKGTAPADASFVYFFNSLSFRGKPDSTIVTNGQWQYDRPQPIGRSMLVLVTDKSLKQQKTEEFVAIMVDTIPAVIDLDKCTVKGSKASEAMNNTWRGLVAIMTNNGSKEDAFRLMRAAVMDNLDTMLPLEFVPLIADGLSIGDLQRIFYPGAPYADMPRMGDAKERLAMLSGQSVRSIGKPFVDLAMNDTAGREHRLSEWCGKGRYVLIDFWASWCGPCRAEMPNVTQSYEKYHDKGFDIVAISFDTTKDAWLRAISSMKMPWIHLSDLAGWKSIGATTYNIRSIPSNILLDGDGKIVDIDLRGEMLDMRLAEIFGK